MCCALCWCFVSICVVCGAWWVVRCVVWRVVCGVWWVCVVRCVWCGVWCGVVCVGCVRVGGRGGVFGIGDGRREFGAGVRRGRKPLADAGDGPTVSIERGGTSLVRLSLAPSTSLTSLA